MSAGSADDRRGRPGTADTGSYAHSNPTASNLHRVLVTATSVDADAERTADMVQYDARLMGCTGQS
jgi:hypothetical protein